MIDLFALRDDGISMGFSLEVLPTATDLDIDDLGAGAANRSAPDAGRMKIERGAADQAPGEISIGYYDVERDYTTGLQRAHFGDWPRAARIELPAVLAPRTEERAVEKESVRMCISGWALYH